MDKNNTKFNISRKQKWVFRGHTVWASWIQKISCWRGERVCVPWMILDTFFTKSINRIVSFGNGNGVRWIDTGFKKWDSSPRERGSALLVTIMITSVVLLFAMILLERIIPYSRQIRGLQDSVQSYYTAKSQIELAKKNFPIERTNVDNTDDRIVSDVDEISLTPPEITGEDPGTYVIVSEHTHLPLKIKLFENDTEPRKFGLSQKNPDFHILSSLSGLLFDLTGRDTGATPLTIEMTTDGGEDPAVQKNLSVEFVHNDTAGTTAFFGNTGPLNTLNGIDIGDIKNNSGDALSKIAKDNNCLSATCSLKVSLSLVNTDPTTESTMIPVSFSVSTDIPDLNAIIVADGISPNETYHSRIIELIPLIQGI